MVLARLVLVAQKVKMNAPGGCPGLDNAECALSGKDAAAVRHQCTWALGYR
jgi:hypothetical protein